MKLSPNMSKEDDRENELLGIRHLVNLTYEKVTY